MNTQDTIKELAQGFSTTAIGDAFFQSLAEYLSKALSVEYVFIGELVNQAQTVRSIAFFAHGQFVDTMEYPLIGSLCEHVVKPQFCAFPSNVQQQFPHNQALKHFGADSYVGTPLFASDGTVLGLLYVMHTQAIGHLETTEALLRIVAKRAELELERKQQERKLIEELEQRKKAEHALYIKNLALQQTNQKLARTEAALVELNSKLEVRVQKRTQQLAASNEELSQTNRQLSQINADLDNFIYTASHDLKGPIVNIDGLLRVLNRKLKLKGVEDEDMETIIRMMHASIVRFKETIADLTEITKLQKQAVQEQTSISLASVIDEVQLDLHTLIQESEAGIELSLQECPAIVFAKKNLQNIVYNLLSNALKYRDPSRKTTIRIACQPSASYLLLSIQDNGLGIEACDQTKIFAMFKRLHDHVEGSGIGLYIVKKILDNAEGKIEVESQVGVGSTFKVYFKV